MLANKSKKFYSFKNVFCFQFDVHVQCLLLIWATACTCVLVSQIGFLFSATWHDFGHLDFLNIELNLKWSL